MPGFEVGFWWMAYLNLVLLLCIILAFTFGYKFYSRWLRAKECLLVLRRLEGPSHQRMATLRPPSMIAPPLPPKPPTPPRSGRLLRKLSFKTRRSSLAASGRRQDQKKVSVIEL
ncbi:uncharacterized protein LOC121873831 [Homarus americanus]|uniref:uncharacterized protein LOC121873831 n=1 Tax=Homarus americanus TaxID=6706 RepID=UPI001C44B2D3|nr:uncharacterized protein LOC121873831 [Homarus americanus]